MEKARTTNKQFVIYLLVAFIPAWIIQVIACNFAKTGNMVAFQLLLAGGVMLIPTLAALAARIPFKGMGFIPHLKGRIRYIFFALWIPVLLASIGCVLFFIFFPNAFDPELQILKSSLEQAGALEQMEAAGITVGLYVIITSVQAVTIYPFMNMIPALGEEIGWRGAMYPYLKDKLGVTKGRIAGGVIWGVWHWPLIFLVGYEYGTDYIGAPVLGPVVFCIFTAVWGILLDHVYEKTECIWLPALLHGAINSLSVFAYISKPEYADKAIFGPAYNGLIAMIPAIALAIFVSVKRKAAPDVSEVME